MDARSKEWFAAAAAMLRMHLADATGAHAQAAIRPPEKLPRRLLLLLHQQVCAAAVAHRSHDRAQTAAPSSASSSTECRSWHMLRSASLIAYRIAQGLLLRRRHHPHVTHSPLLERAAAGVPQATLTTMPARSSSRRRAAAAAAPEAEAPEAEAPEAAQEAKPKKSSKPKKKSADVSVDVADAALQAKVRTCGCVWGAQARGDPHGHSEGVPHRDSTDAGGAHPGRAGGALPQPAHPAQPRLHLPAAGRRHAFGAGARTPS